VPRICAWMSLCVSLVFLMVATCFAEESIPCKDLFPSTTKGFVSIANFDQVKVEWNKTQWAKLLADPVMKPFSDDIRQQFATRWSGVEDRLGLKLDDLRGVPSGEVGIGLIQPGQFDSAIAMVMDVNGNIPEAKTLLKNVSKRLTAKGAKQTKHQESGVTVVIFDIPMIGGDDRERQVIYFLMNDMLGASDNLEEAKGIISRLVGQKGPTLATVAGFQTVMARCAESAGEATPQVSWYLEPLGYIEAVRAMVPKDKMMRNKKTMIEVFKDQGFSAIKGIGGFVDFSVDGYELLHRTAIYAPPPYVDAMKMCVFPNRTDFEPFRWVPRDIATCTTFYLDVKNAFDNFGPLFDELFGEAEYLFSSKMDYVDDLNAGRVAKELRSDFDREGIRLSDEPVVRVDDPSDKWQIRDKGDTYIVRGGDSLRVYLSDTGLWTEVLESIKEDPNGPQVDLRSEIVANLGERVMAITDSELPITTKSERLLFAIEATDEKAAAAGIRKMMESDPTVQRREFEGHVIWETIPDDGTVPAAPVINLPQLGTSSEEEEEEEEETKLLPHAAITVVYGHLVIASHYDFLVKILSKSDARETLANSIEYVAVDNCLKKLGAGENCARSFSRTDEEFRPTYELIKAGKMPESEAIFGRTLNTLFAVPGERQIRKQKIDGKALPDFQVVRRYLGPAGLYAVSVEDGWMIVGCVLPK